MVEIIRHPLKCFDRIFIRLDKLVCRFYKQGYCPYGHECPFPHLIDEERIPDTACRFYNRNMCEFGNDCRNDHVFVMKRGEEMVVYFLRKMYDLRYDNYSYPKRREGAPSPAPSRNG